MHKRFDTEEAAHRYLEKREREAQTQPTAHMGQPPGVHGGKLDIAARQASKGPHDVTPSSTLLTRNVHATMKKRSTRDEHKQYRVHTNEIRN